MSIVIEIPDNKLHSLPMKDIDGIKELIEIGATQVRIEHALAIFKLGNISIWKAARLAGIPLREMIVQASVRGLKPIFDEEMISEELQ
ncbi:MAG: UPF0175 family protein [Methanosarcinales archaeon]